MRTTPWHGGSRTLAAVAVLALILGGCSEARLAVATTKSPYGLRGNYKIGNPYQVKSVWYYPAVDYDYDETGIASWYGADFHNKATANGEIYDMNELTAAHKTLPLPSMVRVTNLENGRSLAVRVNDRGPFVRGRIIDMSRQSAQLLGFQKQGTARVRVQIMADESRTLASLYQSGQQTAALATPSQAAPPPPEAAPLTAVTAQPLGGAPTPAPTLAAPVRILAPEGIEPDGKVSLVAVRPTQIYIQAGAFTAQANALRQQTKLATFGRTRVVPVWVEGQQFFRVRLGPIASVEQADRLLDRVIAAGLTLARVVVD